MNRVTGLITALLLTLATAASAGDRLVVVELYTSQGCSSCPPADAFFHEDLASREDVIALALHVDYWDYLGWKDHFASPQFTKRQKAYAYAAGHRTVYTPQMIIGGEKHVVGTHPNEVLDHIRRRSGEAEQIKVGLTRKANTARIHLQSLDGAHPMAVDVFLVRYTPAEEVAIKRGENAGRMLTYANIVTDWRQVLMWDMVEPVSLKVPVRGKQPIVVIVQKEGSGKILAAARLR